MKLILSLICIFKSLTNLTPYTLILKPLITRRRLFYCVFLISSALFSQQNELDSLSHLLKNYTTKDSIRVKLLLRITESIKHSNSEKALSYTKEAITISSNINWQKGEVLGLIEKGNVYYKLADNLKALNAYQKALTISNDKTLELSLLNNIANIHADLKEYDKALEEYEAFLSIANNMGHKSNQVRGLTNIAIIYTDTNRSEQAITYLNNALVLAKEEKNDFFVAAITNNLGLAYKNLKQYEKSLNLYYEAITMAKTLQNKYIEASAFNSIGKINIILQNYDLAEENGKKALELSENFGAVEWQSDSWKILSTVYETQGKAIDALSAYKKHITLRDSVVSEDKKSEIIRKEMQFRMLEQEIVSNEKIKRQQLIKDGYLAGTVFLIIASIICYVFYKRKRDAQEKKREIDFEVKVANTELKALQAQMNPHFIFNSLNSINSYIIKNDTESATNYLTKFSKLIRKTLESSTEKEVLLKDDIEVLENYLDIEKKRLNNSFTYAIKVDDDIDVRNTFIPPLILQPFLENSIWHGIAKMEHSGHIDVSFKKENNMLLCSVDDNGIGRKLDIKVDKSNKSIGINLTKNRIDIINTQNKTKGSLRIIDKAEGVLVEVKLPLKLAF